MQMLIIAVIAITLVTLVAFIGVPLLLGHIRNIRTIIVRLAVYAGLIIIFCGFYILIFFLIYRYLFKVETLTWEIFFLNGLMIVIFLILFPTINEINYYLNHVFYFDDYDPTFLIRRVTKILATKRDPEEMFKRISLAINLAMGTTFVGFIIRPDGISEKIITAPKRTILPQDAAMLMSLANTLPEQHINTGIASDYPSVDAAMHKHSIAAMIPLKVKSNRHLFGVMLLGPRRRNRSFSPKDMEVINIVSDLLIVALANIVYSDKVEKFNTQLQEEVASSTEKLRQANQTLTNMDAMKDQFTLIASNQLKLPVNIMRGYLDMFAGGDFGKISPVQKEITGNMLTVSENMMQVVDKFVELLSIENDALHVQLREIDFNQLVREEIDNSQIDDADAVFDTKIPSQDLIVNVDGRLIRNVVNSILSNAVRYSIGEKKVSVVVEKHDSNLVFTVTNSGIIPTPAERRQIARRFYRSRAARKMYLDGTGVELYLAQHIIAAHGGKLIKRFKGRKATFGFVLPLQSENK